MHGKSVTLGRAARLAVIGGLLLAGPLAAQTPTTYQACYVPSAGAIYLIGLPRLPTACRATSHVLFAWTDGSHAIQTGAAAAGDLGGTYPNPTVARVQGIAVAATAPAAGQVLSYDGAAWAPATPPAGVTHHGLLSGLADDDHPQYLVGDGVRAVTNGFAITGTHGTGTIPATGTGTRLMWYPGKSAFRAGHVEGEQWDDVYIGRFSMAVGNSVVASGDYSVAMGTFTLASGWNSTAIGEHTTVSGSNSVAMGKLATASGGSSAAIGYHTTASGAASTAMGNSTTASGQYSTAMGAFTTASGPQSTAMGAHTTASAAYSTAMGSSASTGDFSGSFVFGDNSTYTVSVLPVHDNQFAVRAAGGTIFYSSSDLSTGVLLASGGGGWMHVSNRARKHFFQDENGEAILGKIAAIPIQSWSYRSQDPSIRHLGPTAQDFYAAFHLGESDTTITTIDIDGVALLAAQALERRTRDLQTQLAARDREIADLRQRLERLEALLRQR